MAFDANNYVAATGSPSAPYVAVVNGESHPFNSQGEAEQAFRALSGQPEPAASATPPLGTAGNTSTTASAAGQIPQSTPGAPGYVASGTGRVDYNPQATGQLAQIANQAASQAYYDARLKLYDIPMLDIERDKIAAQKAMQAAQLALQDERLHTIDQPMADLKRNELIHQIVQDASDTSLKQRTLDLQGRQLDLSAELGRGKLGVDAWTAANQDANAKLGMALTGFYNADQLDQGRDALGLKSGQQLQDIQNQRQQTALAAASQQFNQGMDVGKLAAQLRGPRNAFTQQAVLHGLNASGVSRAMDALRGGPAASFQGNQAAPQAASIGTMVADANGAGGQGAAYYDRNNPYAIAGGIARQDYRDQYGQGGRLTQRIGARQMDPASRTNAFSLGQMATNMANNPYGSPATQGLSAYGAAQSRYGQAGGSNGFQGSWSFAPTDSLSSYQGLTNPKPVDDNGGAAYLRGFYGANGSAGGSQSGGSPAATSAVGAGPARQRTVQQLRDELHGAGYPNWQNAGNDELLSVYKRTSGTDTSLIPG